MERPPARPDAAAITLRPIGVVRSPFKVHLEAPRQPGVAPIAEGSIELRRGLQNTLKDLARFSHVWVLFWCNFSRGWNQQLVPPRDAKKRGLFATRSPHRPNPIGLSVVELLSIRGTRLRIRGVDMLDGTPVLDLKPYVRYADARPEASDGWLADLPPDPGPDHRDWQTALKVRGGANGRGGGPLATALLAIALCTSCGGDDRAASGGGGDHPRGGNGAAERVERESAAAPDPEAAGVLDSVLAPPRRGDSAAAQPWFEQAVALRGAWRSRDKARFFDRALEIDPGHPAALTEYGFLLMEPGADQNLGRALLLFRRALLVEPDRLHAVVGEGFTRAALGDAARAEPLLRRGLAELPTGEVDRRAWAGLALADLCAADGRHDEALTLYRQAAGPTTSALPRGAALIRRGSLLAQLDRGAEAEAELRAALVLDPENVRAHYLLAQILSRRGDPAARAEAAKEQRIHGLLRELRDHLSTLYVKDTARRTRLWRELAAAWPENRLLLHSLVRDQLEGGDWGGAHATCAELRQRDGDSAALCWFEARAAAGGGDLAAAKRFADAMERLDPKVPSSVLRTILDDWRRGNPETVDGARYERTVREWLAGR